MITEQVATRTVIVVDRDRGFSDFVAATLVGRGLAVRYLDGGTLALDQLADAALVLLAVDLPGKEGFTICSRLKGRSRGRPVIVVTETLSAEEMKLHSNLRFAADAYLDKRVLSQSQVLHEVSRLLRLPAAGDAPTPNLSYFAWHEANVDEPGLGEPEEVSLDEPELGEVISTEVQAAVQALRDEIAAAGWSARNSRFGPLFEQLEAALQARDDEILALRQELKRRDDTLEASHLQRQVRSKLLEQVDRILAPDADGDDDLGFEEWRRRRSQSESEEAP